MLDKIINNTLFIGGIIIVGGVLYTCKVFYEYKKFIECVCDKIEKESRKDV